MFRRRTVYAFLCLLGTILVGTVVVLSSISYYLHINDFAYISETELDAPLDGPRWNASEHGKVERIPRILHQTWKSETLPPKWTNVSQGCRDMMPDYEYKLWTDASSREFIAEQYPWFLDTFDGYTYPIQRADVIRYFILYHYGGVYMDLDIGCVRPIDPLLTYSVILPVTDPVGISNDLIFAEQGHPFMAQTIHNLVAFDHNWILNYPTVMFSTGPMFLSFQYGLYTTRHPQTREDPGEIRVLPKSLYGKNLKPEQTPHTFFAHYYGSSWHADDAAFIGFLGKWGTILMWIGLAVLVIGIIRLALAPHVKQRKYSLRRIGGYEVMMPRWRTQQGRWHLDLGWFTLPASGSSTQPTSPISLSSDDEDEVQLLPLSLDSRAFSPSPSDLSFGDSMHTSSSHGVMDALKRAGNTVRRYLTGSSEYSHPRRPRRRSRGVLFFLPAFFTPSHGVDIVPPRSLSRSRGFAADSSSFPEYPPDKPRSSDEYETTRLVPASDSIPHSRAGSSSSESTVC